MKYLHTSIRVKRGKVLRVLFDQPTKVMILSDLEYKNYQNHRTFTYYGGYSEEESFEIEVPRDGVWHVVVELGSYFNPKSVNASVQISEPDPSLEPVVSELIEDGNSEPEAILEEDNYGEGGEEEEVESEDD